jgi:CheY-like chemotaxis protein
LVGCLDSEVWAKLSREVALTGYGQPDDRRRAVEAGFDAHVVKPVDPDELSRILTA